MTVLYGPKSSPTTLALALLLPRILPSMLLRRETKRRPQASTPGPLQGSWSLVYIVRL